MNGLPSPEIVDLPDAVLQFHDQVFGHDQAQAWFDCLLAELQWQTEEIHIFGRRVTVPRLLAWYGDPGASYRYSGVDHEPLDWTPTLAKIRSSVQEIAGAAFNGVLANRYRDGGDRMGWHSDDEPELGNNPVIASLSLGATRRMRFRRRDNHRETCGLDLPAGSLLVMRGATQRHWQHCISRSRRVSGERINLTFRLIYSV